MPRRVHAGACQLLPPQQHADQPPRAAYGIPRVLGTAQNRSIDHSCLQLPPRRRQRKRPSPTITFVMRLQRKSSRQAPGRPGSHDAAAGSLCYGALRHRGPRATHTDALIPLFSPGPAQAPRNPDAMGRSSSALGIRSAPCGPASFHSRKSTSAKELRSDAPPADAVPKQNDRTPTTSGSQGPCYSPASTL